MSTSHPSKPRAAPLAVQALIYGVAATLLFWALAGKDLWQDEAATAVLAVRMLKFGRPMAYDGVNLLTDDMLYEDDDATLSRRTREPRAALDFYVQQKNFKPDTTWKWQPWGLFAIAAASIKLLGATTLAARLPFALLGFATVPLLFRWVHRQFGSLTMAATAAVLLVGNSYWILHARQCRYYPASSFFLVLLLVTYGRWQWGGRGPAAFLVTAWCWFQVDYGTVLPVLGVLFLEALLSDRKRFRRTVTAGAILAATLVPFVIFYDLLHRGSATDISFRQRFGQNLFNTNEFVAPLLIVAVAVWLLARNWRTLAEGERRIVALCCAIVVALNLWLPVVTVYAFVRYIIVAAPIGGLIAAWVLARIFRGRHTLAWLATAVMIVTPMASLPARWITSPAEWWAGSLWRRVELADLRDEVFGRWPDPNRIVIDYLRRHAAPTDEILINYEDFPLMYYLPNPIRGGVAAFRVEDDAKTKPRWVILRHSADFVHWPVFDREVARYQWERIPIQAPDVQWGNNPDPTGDDDPRSAPNLYFARRIGD